MLHTDCTYYKPKHFRPEELLDRDTLALTVQYKVVPWTLFDPRLLLSLDGIRDYFGKPVIINDWLWDGNAQWRGLRTPKAPAFSPLSQHSFGRAGDLHIRDIEAEEARQAILAHNNDPRFRFITRMEKGVSWLHIDTANVNGRIVLFGA